MTRQFLDDLKAQISANMPDNDQGLISPSIARTNFFDTIDSCVQDEAGLTSSTAATITVNLTAAWTVISDLVDPPTVAYDTVIGGDAEFLIVDQAAGTITSSSTAGWTYEAIGAVTINAPNNEVIEAAIGVNGAPGDLVASNVGSSGTRPESLFLRRYVPSTVANSAFSIIVRAPDGTANGVEITNRSWGLIIQPTRDPA